MTIYIRLEKPCKRDEMLNNNVRRLRDESLLNFALCVFRWHVGCVIHTALNTGCKVAVKKFKFLMYDADCINLGSTGKYFRKRQSIARFVAN